MSARDRQAEATRDLILDTAMELLADDPGGGFSHEAVAAKAKVGARTVYRYFPNQADLFQALWERLRDRTGTRFPAGEDEIVPLVKLAFRQFDGNQALVRAFLASEAGGEVRARGAAEGRAAFGRSLAPLLAGLSEREKAKVVGVALAIYSAPFWQMLRDRGGLCGRASQEAAAWAMEAVLKAAKDLGKKDLGKKKK